MARRTFLAALVLIFTVNSAWAMTPEQRRDYSRKLLEILPAVSTRGNPSVNTFRDWVEQTGAIAPDFDALPKINGLPDPFTFFDGKRKVQTPEDWKARRAEILDLFQKYSWGTMPPKPNLDRIVVVDPAVAAAEAAARGGRGGFGARRGGPATQPGAVARGPASAPAGRAGRGAARGGGPAPVEGMITKIVDLYYGPNSQIVQRVTVNIPPGPGPFPVLMGGNAGITSRGYISCSIPSNVDGPPNIGQYYPEHTWGSMAKCAWSTQMVVDYLHTLPEVDKRYIAITGYSRGGKYATISAAIDERITAVLAGSTGVGGLLTWRQGSEVNVAESIESTTRMFPIWFTPSFRFFSGREDRLPVDGNLLAALVAPRALLSFYGLNDEVANTWGNEQTHHDALKVYQLLGHPDRLGIHRVDGVNKHHAGGNDPEATSRWLDIQFGKSTEKWTNTFLFPWNYEKWKQASGESVDINAYPRQATGPLATEGDGNALINSSGRWEGRADAIMRAVRWTLGEAPSDTELAKSPVTNPGDEGIDDTPRWVINRSIIEHGWTRDQAEGIAVRDIRFGPGKIRGDIYYKQGTPAGTKLPTVIFLHGNSYPLGYMWVYRMDPHPIIALANAGYAVLAFDQSGYGSRMTESKSFYQKYPKWSQMGRMVADAKAAVEAVRTDELCDGRKIYLFGFGTGGAVALHTAAMDLEVKGVVSICGFTPMRTDTPDKGTGGIARLYQERGFLPRLGFFAGEESRIPYDYNELIATVAPRPVYIFSPEYNREATAADVKNAVDQARTVYQTQYNAGGKLMLDQPFDYFRLSGPAQDRIVAWMTENMK